MSHINNIKNELNHYCAQLGQDPLLVQGAGGNISFKEQQTLWIKASGMWLADALDKEIFVPVNLPHLQSAIKAGDFAVVPQTQGETKLRPSIETLLHALMPQPVVLHLHAVDILAHLVRSDCRENFRAHPGLQSIQWAWVDYFKPGAELAAAVASALSHQPKTQVVFLKNHGVVLGGPNSRTIDSLLQTLLTALKTEITEDKSHSAEVSPLCEYSLVQDQALQELALNPQLFRHLKSHWVLYPDHVVFLGPKPNIYGSWEAYQQAASSLEVLPELIFIENKGIYAQASFTKAKHEQLRCYFDVLVRQPEFSRLNTLSHPQIAELLNWDAEKYRMAFNQ